MMANLPKISKPFLYLTVLSGSLWLGSYFTRLITTYQLFQETDYQLRAFINDQNLSGILIVLNALAAATLILYVIFILSLLVFSLTSKLNLRQNGWYFIILLIVLITLPFEVYLMTIDYKIVFAINSGSFDPVQILNLYKERFKLTSNFPIIEIFCYFAIIYFILFKPFTLKNKVQI